MKISLQTTKFSSDLSLNSVFKTCSPIIFNFAILFWKFFNKICCSSSKVGAAAAAGATAIGFS
jgi:hypothetical protein